MALLHRFVKLNDRGNTHVFSFVVTRSVTRDLHRDVTSKELTYGYQKWAITFSRSEKVLGVYLVWRNPCEGMRVYIDFTFTLLNREHFSTNEAFTGKQVKFTFDSPAQGKRKLINMDDLYSRNFTDLNGEFQLELTVANIRTVFEAEMRCPLPGASLSATTSGSTSTTLNEGGGAGVSTRKEKKYESPYFHFGHYDWHISVTGTGSGADSKPTVQLRRLTGFDHQCRVRYLMVIGEGERRTDSGILDQLSDHEGRTPSWNPQRVRMSDLVNKGVVKLYLEMLLANTTSEVKVSPLVPQTSAVHLYDRDKAAWAIEPDLHSDMFRLRLVYNDVHNVARNHLRYMCWNAYLLRTSTRGGGYVESVCLANGPFSNYYAQESLDDGIIMESEVPVEELKNGTSNYLDEKKDVTVQIEWIESLLLFQATYHKYDDVTRMHNYQMRREIASLETENYSLERQLVSYQKSISYAHSRGTYSDEALDERLYADTYAANGKRDYPEAYGAVIDKKHPETFPNAVDKRGSVVPGGVPLVEYALDKRGAAVVDYPTEVYPAVTADKRGAVVVGKPSALGVSGKSVVAGGLGAIDFPGGPDKYVIDKTKYTNSYSPNAYATSNGKRGSDYGRPRGYTDYSGYDRGFSTDTEYA